MLSHRHWGRADSGDLAGRPEDRQWPARAGHGQAARAFPRAARQGWGRDCRVSLHTNFHKYGYVL